MNLLDDVKRSFEEIPEATGNAKMKSGGIAVFATDDQKDPVTGFFAMREYTSERLKVMVRRGYRQHAGVDLPQDADEALSKVAPTLGPLVTSVVIETFCDGVQIGQGTSHPVKMAKHYDRVNELFANESFRAESLVLALQFSEDQGVRDFFANHTLHAVQGLGEVTGYSGNQGISYKVWDLWLMSGGSMSSAAYIAGHQLGMHWGDRELTAELEDQMKEDDDDGSA